MIRFSAALVAVAIGVLIGGIATSKLLLVYIAIVVSAVALVALIIGVVLRRDELFGEEQGLVPAAAGASPAPQARVGVNQDAGVRHDKVPASAHVPPPPPLAGAAGGYGAAFAGAGTAPSTSSTGTGSATARTAATGQDRSAETRSAEAVPPWQTAATRGPWSSSTAADWVPGGPDARAVGGAGGRVPSAWQDAKPGGTEGDRAGGWGAHGADAEAAGKAPRPWATSSPTVSADSVSAEAASANTGAPAGATVSADATTVQPAAAPDATTPSWFDRLGGSASTEAPPTVPAPVAGPGSGWSWSNPGGSGAGGTDTAATSDSAPGDTDDNGLGGEDDDWPTRYSWLDDDAEDSGAAQESGAASEDPDATVRTAMQPKSEPADAAPDQPGAPADASPVVTSDAVTTQAETSDAASDVTDSAEESGADVIAFPRRDDSTRPHPASEANGHGRLADEPGADSKAEAPVAAEAEASASAAAAAQVTVVPGVPRYHKSDCVLIRFMPEGDVQQMSVEEANEAGCTPCAACQPDR